MSRKRKTFQEHPGPYPRKGDSGNIAVTQPGRVVIQKLPYQTAAEDLPDGVGRFAGFGSLEEITRADAIERALQAGYSKTAAAIIADISEGTIDRDELLSRASRNIHAAKVLAYRDDVQLPVDPAATRGGVELPSTDDFLERKPSVGVSVGVLRSLDITGSRLFALEYSLFWTLVSITLTRKVTRLELGVLRDILKIPDNDRLLSHFKHLSEAVFSIVDEPTIRPEHWISGVHLLSYNLIGDEIEWTIDQRLLRLIKPRRQGSRYAYLCIRTVRYLTAAWQERAYRYVLAAATESGAFSASGGECVWGLELPDLRKLWSAEAVKPKTFKSRRFEPLKEALDGVDSRIRLDGFEPIYDEWKKGKPVIAARLRFKVLEAPPSEQPKNPRPRLIEKAYWPLMKEWVNVVGTKKVDSQKATAERSQRAVAGHKTKRAHLAKEDDRRAEELIVRMMAARPRMPVPEVIPERLPDEEVQLPSDATAEDIIESFLAPIHEPLSRARKRAFEHDPRIILAFGHTLPDHFWEQDIELVITLLEDAADVYRKAAAQRPEFPSHDEAGIPDFMIKADDDEGHDWADEQAIREAQDDIELEQCNSFDD